MNRAQVNKWLPAVGVVVGLAIVAVVVVIGIRGTTGPQAAVATATPAAADAEPTVGPGASATAAAGLAAQAQGTTTAGAAAIRAADAAVTRRIYTLSVELSLQRYVDAMAGLRDSTRQVAAQPSLAADPVWRARTTTSLGAMQRAAADMTAAGPAPQDLGNVTTLLGQIVDQTARLSQASIGGTGTPETVDQADVAAARATIGNLGEILLQANYEIRRGAPGTS